MILKNFNPSKACQVRSSIRCTKEIELDVLVGLFHKDNRYKIEDYDVYLYGFFEECYPDLIREFMKENSITRDEILNVFNDLSECGEKHNFKKALENGDF